MSAEGARKMVGVLVIMQVTRQELLAGDNQDKRLGQLLQQAEDSINDQVSLETLEEPDH